jgi:hypothetical protein
MPAPRIPDRACANRRTDGVRIVIHDLTDVISDLAHGPMFALKGSLTSVGAMSPAFS